MSDLVLYEHEFREVNEILSRLRVTARAKRVSLLDHHGQQIASKGESRVSIDATSLASLTADSDAAADRLSKLLAEKEFSILFHEGERDNLHVAVIKDRIILVVIFDERSSLGRVRREAQVAAKQLERTIRSPGRDDPDDDGGMPSPVPRSGGGPTPAPASMRVRLPRDPRSKN